MINNERADQQPSSHERQTVTRRQVLYGGIATAATVAILGAGTKAAFGQQLRDAAALVPLSKSSSGPTYQIAREIGATQINHTDRWGLYGADLGHMFLHRGKLYMVFGDSFGAPAADNFFSVGHSDWRSNTMAWIQPPSTPVNGLAFSGMITDTPGHAKELLSSKKVDGVEMTVIPTYGVSVDERMFSPLHVGSTLGGARPLDAQCFRSGLFR